MVQNINVYFGTSKGLSTANSAGSISDYSDALNGELRRIVIRTGSPISATGSVNVVIQESGTGFSLYTNNNFTTSITDIELGKIGSEVLVVGPLHTMFANMTAGSTATISYYIV